MLRPELARERLKEFEVKDLHQQRLKRVGDLPTRLRPVGWAALGLDAQGKDISGHHQFGISAAALAQADNLSVPDRLLLFQALMPRLAQDVENAWQLHARLPYQQGYVRKSFRAPNHRKALRTSRAAWLRALLWSLKDYDPDVAWLAAWAPHLNYGQTRHLAPLFAAAIDQGGPAGEEIYQILLASARGEHPVGSMGRHVTSSLLMASRPEGWEFLERLLVAAQREEGLRQVILEAADEGHPEAFRRMLRVVLDQHLSRFAAVARAADVWFGLGWNAEDTGAIERTLAAAVAFLERPETRVEAIERDPGEGVYFALWSLAYDDAAAAVVWGTRVLADPDPERRFGAAYLLSQIGLPESFAALVPVLEDSDLCIARTAAGALHQFRGQGPAGTDIFDAMERLMLRAPEKETILPPLIWPWMRTAVSQAYFAELLREFRGARSPAVLLPHLSRMDADTRLRLATTLRDTPEAETRAALFVLLRDASSAVRDTALEAIRKLRIAGEEARLLEDLLTRKAGSFRSAALAVLLNQEDAAVLESAGRLMQAAQPLQRTAGLELLKEMIDRKRLPGPCRALARRRKTEPPVLSAEEKTVLERILQDERPPATLENALGLMDPAERTQPTAPKKIWRLAVVTDATRACLQSLDALAREHRETEVTFQPRFGPQPVTQLLGSLQYGFPAADPSVPLEEDRQRLPLREVWEAWWASRPAALRDRDGLELVRAMHPFQAHRYFPHVVPQGRAPAAPGLFLEPGQLALEYPRVVASVIDWLVRIHPAPGAPDFLLDAVEQTFSVYHRSEEWRKVDQVRIWLQTARRYRTLHPEEWKASHQGRLWRLLCVLHDPGRREPRPATLEEVLAAWRGGGATEADILEHLIGPRAPRTSPYAPPEGFYDLRRISGRKTHPLLVEYPILREMLARCRRRILEIETERGDMPTAASAPALALRYVEGTDTLLRLLQALGKDILERTHGGESKRAVLSHLLQVCFPAPGDTVEQFRDRVREEGLPEARLVEVAVFAPQWTRFVEHALGWAGLDDGVWWLRAHTRDSAWSVDPEIRETWAAEVAERTPLTPPSLVDGAVDVAWFHQAYGRLGEKRWLAVDAAARYASSASGHKRAQLFADAMLGRARKTHLLKRMTEKRHQDSVRSLGLLPLEPGGGDLLERYQVIQEFVRTSRKFGAQRQASEKQAASIGLANLARSAGYPDPVRLEWAMERAAVADLSAGPVTVHSGDMTACLSVNELGEAKLSFSRAGKPLKSLPPAAKKDEAIAHLQTRQKELIQQASRIRLSLEEAMCRGDRFTGEEIRGLMSHPILAPMLRSLVLVEDREGGEAGAAGYPVEGGTALESYDGTIARLDSKDTLRIAHSYDLFRSGEWHRWQRDCFLRERVQPFKQVFRELYLLTPSERADDGSSLRYAGHGVNPGQAVALLGKRGWVSHPEEGIRRTFHDTGIVAWISFVGGFFTPAEVEGLTIEGVGFSRRGEWQALGLEEVPPRVFSEVMRDLDLVVSVAHRGGVDPEASASTTEMRASLIRESCRLLKIENVRLQERFALVDGHLGTYSIHLGSGVVHRQPGGHLCIIPVHSQHRGRLFLPFADDDPRTAEILSKVVLLARDREIKDPTILEQIMAQA